MRVADSLFSLKRVKKQLPGFVQLAVPVPPGLGEVIGLTLFCFVFLKTHHMMTNREKKKSSIIEAVRVHRSYRSEWWCDTV